MREAALVTKIKKALEKEGCWVLKVHGGPYQQAGVPDLIACCEGAFLALEVKVPKRRSNVTQLQAATIQAIRRVGGTAYVIASVKEAVFFASCLKEVRNAEAQ